MHTTFVIFGITGDLSGRKLLPALHGIAEAGVIEPFSILGISRKEVEASTLIQQATNSSLLLERTSMMTMDVANPDEYARLAAQLPTGDDHQVVIYLSVPPGAAADIADFLGQAGINGTNVKILFEKPFGYDTESAIRFVDRTARYFDESHLYRIDHYMAKEVALSLMELRADADRHHHHWSNDSVESVEVLAAETLGVEGRAGFYEQTGALRDVIQGHLMQLLSLVIMRPVSLEEMAALPQARAEALQQLQVADPAMAVRAQYQGYDEDVGNPGSRTETFAHIVLSSHDPRWQGVPLLITTGKCLSEKYTRITITYKDGTVDCFKEGDVVSSLSQLPEAYQRVLVAAVRGEKHLFTTSAEIISSWRVLGAVQRAWSLEDTPLLGYPQGQDYRHVHLNRYI